MGIFFPLAPERDGGSVIERTQHTGDVNQWRSLQRAFTERAARFSLKIDDHKILAGVEHLPEVIVTVDCDLCRCDFAFKQARMAFQDSRCERDNRIAEVMHA